MRETITTHDIRVGDLILNYGMRLRVDQEIHVSKAHPIESESQGACLWTRAMVENLAELEASADAGDSTAKYLLSFIKSDMSPNGDRARNGKAPDTEPRWTIQGNRWAKWAREV